MPPSEVDDPLRHRPRMPVGRGEAVVDDLGDLAVGERADLDEVGLGEEGLRLIGEERAHRRGLRAGEDDRSEEHTSELQSLMRISYAVFCLTKHISCNEHIHLLNPTYTIT